MHTSTEGLLYPKVTAQLDEARWLAAAKQGEPWALEQLFQTYHRAVYALCYRMLSRADDAEDATQAAFVGAFRGLANFRGGASLKTWLYRIAANESLSMLRARRTKPELLWDEPAMADGTPGLVQKAAVQTVLRQMPPEQRLVLILFYWEELSCEEIARVAEITVSAAKMRLKRAREEFQRRYGAEP